MIDEDGTRSLKLNVVGGRIAERKSIRQQVEMKIEMQQRRGLERGKCPLIRIGDEWDPGMLQQDAG